MRLIFLVSLFSILGSAHYVLQYPISIGYNDALETTGPCGSFSATDRSKGVTNWPVAGSAIKVLTTHPSVTWEFRAAKLSAPTVWTSLTPILTQTAGIGTLCEPQIPGLPAWIGLDAILQIISHAPDGNLYQCAAIKFVAGGPAAPPAGCTNTTGFALHW
ncbi:hypothetical protein BCR34DRAFT_576860 [Clohesyomyces aquaticus]|uniref:Copper acquisition factor BIM1-like domain-containing protein n=1 Tax=Clohesyomyces aquaticus TaxID=1231657 RepID=A0A1Y1YM80_9PLEO|nr:hypothetical protein BCR34DRAFT_576860 [Clohesyomyces aquaticus]